MRGSVAKKLRRMSSFKKSDLFDEKMELQERNRKYYGGKAVYKISKKAWKMTPHNEKD